MIFYNDNNVIYRDNSVLNIDVKKDNSPYLSFPILSKINFIKHGFSTRLGGVSKGCFESMNLGYNRGDEKSAVDVNYSRICESIGIPMEALVSSDQVHNTDIKLVTLEDKGKGVIREKDYHGIDGLITNIPGIPLVTFYADCVPLYFVDTKNKAIGLSHSGWRGTVKKIGKETLDAMAQHFGTKPHDVVALIGPSICQECYEVSQDVANAFREVFTKSQLESILYEKGEEKYLLNLWNANRYILLDSGVPDSNICISGVCTSCNSDILFSHRKSKGFRGTLAAFLMIRSGI